MQQKLEQELKRFAQFQQVVGIDAQSDPKSDEINIKEYAKYLLKEGEDQEKRDLLSCLKGEILLKNKETILE